ncbi:MAG: glutamate synthase subunit beta, partial [Deltaproteobacteria bacterium]|nr:glutamate synthase subunit beta [Deltaproteobacteria bacterium]
TWDRFEHCFPQWEHANRFAFVFERSDAFRLRLILNKNFNQSNMRQAIAQRAWEEGFIKPVVPSRKTGKKIAVVGSGPAGMAAAQQLCRAGHDVTLFEKNQHAGGLMRYGIPDFKCEKELVERRVQQMEDEGVTFKTGVAVGVNFSVDDLKRDFDAVLLACGSEKPRDLPVEGRNLDGIHFAMDFLPQQNKRVSGESFDEKEILATGKKVVVIGGGDTGSDCIGTSLRQGATSVTSLELMPAPPDGYTAQNRHPSTPWPSWPKMPRASSSHKEGGTIEYQVMTTRFEGENGKLKRLHIKRVEFGAPDAAGRPSMKELEGSDFVIEADLVLLAMGFVHPVHEGLVSDMKLELDARGNVLANTEQFETSQAGVFAAGDVRRGQSLVVWALWEGREAARAVDIYLMGDEATLQSRDAHI